MLYEFKGYNKMSNLINEYESEKKVLLKNIELLKLYNKKSYSNCTAQASTSPVSGQSAAVLTCCIHYREGKH